MPPDSSTIHAHRSSSEIASCAVAGHPVTIVTGHMPYDVAPARTWAAHGAFLGWCEREHGSVEKAVQVLVEGRQRA